MLSASSYYVIAFILRILRRNFVVKSIFRKLSQVFFSEYQLFTRGCMQSFPGKLYAVLPHSEWNDPNECKANLFFFTLQGLTTDAPPLPSPNSKLGNPALSQKQKMKLPVETLHCCEEQLQYFFIDSNLYNL